MKNSAEILHIFQDLEIFKEFSKNFCYTGRNSFVNKAVLAEFEEYDDISESFEELIDLYCTRKIFRFDR